MSSTRPDATLLAASPIQPRRRLFLSQRRRNRPLLDKFAEDRCVVVAVVVVAVFVVVVVVVVVVASASAQEEESGTSMVVMSLH